MNERIMCLKESASAALMAQAKELQRTDPSIISLAGGEPDFPTPERVTRAAIRALNAGDTHYCIGPGLPELRAAIANKFRIENGIDCTEDSILVTPGGKNAIFIAINTILQPGDEAIILEPAWVSYEPIVIATGATPIHVKLDYRENYRIHEEVLEDATTTRTRLLIINYPNNPTGRVLHKDEADIIENYLNRHPAVYLLSDEIYEKIIFDQNVHISLGARSSVAERVITVNGFSKSVAMTGWRVGYMSCSKSVFQTAYKLYQHSLTCMSGFVQKAAVAAFECADETERMRRAYEIRRGRFIDVLNSIPGVYCALPEGAFYAWVKFDLRGYSSENVFEYLLNNARVVGMPGIAYGETDISAMRFSFANSDADIETAAGRIKETLFKLTV